MSRIERWTRQLLEAEARKRGIRDPEVRSRSELLWAIAQHDYGARQSLRNARKLVGNLIHGATHALPMFARRGQAKPATLPGEAPDAADAWQVADQQVAAERSASLQPAAAASNAAAREVPAQASRLQLRRADGQLEFTWQVNELDAQRARVLLGQHGELSLRIVCVQADATQVVRSSVTEHGPLDANGAWTWVLPGPDASCVGSIGVRHGARFVSIAHESSRVPLASAFVVWRPSDGRQLPLMAARATARVHDRIAWHVILGDPAMGALPARCMCVVRVRNATALAYALPSRAADAA